MGWHNNNPLIGRC